MKKQSYSFPSVYEATGTNLSFVSKDLINGLQLYDEHDQSYIIGNLALNEGVSPNKLVNSSPYELDYQLLLQAGLLLANQNNNRPLAITTGFPFSTFQIYKEIAKQTILNLKSVEYNPGTFKSEERIVLKTDIQQVEILPEMIGNIIGLRVGEAQASGNFFVVSLGYGTCEAVLSTENGIVHRTASSINGMQYAVDLFMRSLATKYYLGLKTEKQLDVSFRNDYIILDRQKINIVDLRRRILERYYTDVISNGLRKSFTDSDFERADKIYLTGGGALFPELVELFDKEFKQIAKVEVVKNPLTLTSEGYSLNSIMLTNGDESTAVGLDIGNANTVLTQYVDETSETETHEKIVVKEKLKETTEKKNEIVVEKTEIKLEKTENQPVVEEKIIEIDKEEEKISSNKKQQFASDLEKKIVEILAKKEENIDNQQKEDVKEEEVSELKKQEIETETKIDIPVIEIDEITELTENQSVSIEKIIRKDEPQNKVTEEKEIQKVEKTIKEEKIVDQTGGQDEYEPDFS